MIIFTDEEAKFQRPVSYFIKSIMEAQFEPRLSDSRPHTMTLFKQAKALMNEECINE